MDWVSAFLVGLMACAAWDLVKHAPARKALVFRTLGDALVSLGRWLIAAGSWLKEKGGGFTSNQTSAMLKLSHRQRAA
jgi:hypothetical protein